MKQKKDHRRARYVKARNIINNNMQKNRYQVIDLTAKTAYKFIRAYQLFQASRLEAKQKREDYRRLINSKLAEVK